MSLTRSPALQLRRFVSRVWATGEPAPSDGTTRREHVLSTGAMHLVFRLSGPPLRLFRDAADHAGQTVGFAIVGGARTAFYARDVSMATCSVGAQLLPGAALALFGLPADELAGRHTPLDALWGRDAELALEQLHAAATPARRLQVLEVLIAARLSQACGLHPAVALALRRLPRAAGVGDIVQGSGYSHRLAAQGLGARGAAAAGAGKARSAARAPLGRVGAGCRLQ